MPAAMLGERLARHRVLVAVVGFYVLVQVLERAWSERPPLEVIAGDACGIDGCE